MGVITGQGSALQIGEETTWGTAVAPSVALNFLSEGFKLVPDYVEEETLVGGATSREMDIMKKSVSWDMSLLAKPENIGLLLALAFGVEGSATGVTGVTGAYTHAFTMIKPSVSNSLKKFTAVLDRHVSKKAYSGCKVGSLGIEVSKGDYMRITASGVGKDEADGSSLYDGELTVPDTKAFRFAGGTCTIDGTNFGDVESVSFSLDNALDEGEQTLGSGIYGTENEPQKRSVSLSLDAFFNSTSDTIRTNKFVAGAKAAVVLKFESPDVIVGTTKYSIQIALPLVVINDCSPNVTGNGKLKLTIGGVATESASTEAVTVTLTDGQSTKYSA